MRLGRKLRKIEDGLADIAAKSHALAAHRQEMGGERRRGRFAVGAGDDHDLGRRVLRAARGRRARCRRSPRRRPHSRRITLQCGFGMGQRNARRENEGGNTATNRPRQRSLNVAHLPPRPRRARLRCHPRRMGPARRPLGERGPRRCRSAPAPTPLRPGRRRWSRESCWSESTAISAWRGRQAQAPRR